MMIEGQLDICVSLALALISMFIVAKSAGCGTLRIGGHF